jgi:hypothetical protein
MAKFALILEDGTVERLIVADQAFIDSDPIMARGPDGPQRLSKRYPTVVEVIYDSGDAGDTAEGPSPVKSRDCTLGAGYDAESATFVRPVAGLVWDKATKQMVVVADKS